MNKHYLKAVMAGSSTDATRPALNSVLAQRDGDKIRLVATNGHVLYRTTFNQPIQDAPVSPEGKGAYAVILDTIIPLSICKTLVSTCKPAKLFSHNADIYLGADEALVNLTTRISTNPLRDETFPSYEKVIPDTEGKTLFSLNLSVLESLVNFAKGIRDARDQKGSEFGINFYLGKPDSAIYFEIEGNGYNVDEKSDGVIMPRRIA